MKRSLRPEMDVTEFRAYYWMKADLVRFARQLRLPTHGYKPELCARIERRLQVFLPLPSLLWRHPMFSAIPIGRFDAIPSWSAT